MTARFKYGVPILLIGVVVVLLGVILFLVFQRGDEAVVETAVSGQTITITSPAFTQGSPIPALYTCDDQNISPELTWSGVPEEATSLVLIMDDPDAPVGTFVHWVVYNLPPDIDGLAAGVPADEQLANGGIQGVNGRRQTGYTGPCPPTGEHRYFFKIYALDTLLTLAPGANKAEVVAAMEGHILASGELMGTYSR
ncbi:MAG: YbhB/YbcL family Raf kinase inhibitor-like protein [Chloroflexi bacterium]|nr:MAG: YbhB/YbcL family Raf kinase inhibitor-like protein [Chloroflexota bacterium]